MGDFTEPGSVEMTSNYKETPTKKERDWEWRRNGIGGELVRRR